MSRTRSSPHWIATPRWARFTNWADRRSGRFREILAFILKQTQRDKRLVDIPMGIARMQASIMQHMPGQPLTPDQLLMLSKDNVVAPGALGLADLGITPTPAELVVPSYLSRFQPGGGRRPPVPLAAA